MPFSSASTTAIEFLDMQAQTNYQTYILVRFTSTNQVILFYTYQQSALIVYAYTAT